MADKAEILQGRVINTYLAASKLPAFKGKKFFDNGVMLKTFERLWDTSGVLSSGEQLFFEVAREIWTWHPSVKIKELADLLDTERLELTFSLYLAWAKGTDALEAWITEHSSKPE